MLNDGGQLLVFIQFFLSGAVGGAVYSGLWILRLVLGENKVSSFVFDILFFVLIAVIFSFSSVLISNSSLRFYMVFSFALGLVCYLLCIQGILHSVYLRLRKFCVNAFKKRKKD